MKTIRIIKGMIIILSLSTIFTSLDTIFIFERSFYSYLAINLMEWTLGITAFIIGRMTTKI